MRTADHIMVDYCNELRRSLEWAQMRFSVPVNDWEWECALTAIGALSTRLDHQRNYVARACAPWFEGEA